jgi:hypothetical protein
MVVKGVALSIMWMFNIFKWVTQQVALNPLFTSIYINLFDHDTFPLNFVNKTNLFSNNPLQIVLIFFHLCSGNCKMQRGSCKCTPNANARTFSSDNHLQTLMLHMSLWHRFELLNFSHKWRWPRYILYREM